MNARRAQRKGERGVVLAMVLILSLLLSASVFAFTRRAVIDATLARNRDAAASAEALARGGIQIAIFALLADLLVESQTNSGYPVGETHSDIWAQLSSWQLDTPEGGQLTVKVSDQGALLNLNTLVDYTEADSSASEEAEEFVKEFLEVVIDELPLPPGEKELYINDREDLAENLLDWLDSDGIRLGPGGGDEDSYYQRQDPPYKAANGQLLSVDELRRIEGFDAVLVEGIRPYVTVHPLSGGGGINLNTAPPHVLKMIYHGTSSDMRMIQEDDVRRILDARADDQLVCDDTSADSRCISLSEVLDGSIYPPVQLPSSSRAFTVEATARVADVRRTIEAVVDRSDPTAPRLLSWRTR